MVWGWHSQVLATQFWFAPQPPQSLVLLQRLVTGPQATPLQEGAGQTQALALQVRSFEQPPQSATLRALPQLSMPVSAPQVAPLRVQKAASLSAVHTEQVLSPRHMPLEHPPQLTLRMAPQLSGLMMLPQAAPLRAQKVGSSSATHSQALPTQTSSAPEQPPQLASRAMPQLS